MSDGYHCNEDGDCSPTWLDELLCEYVDGTMDPVVRESFEEVLRQDLELARQVERLQDTRSLLCHHGCQMHALQGLQTRVRQRLACELMRAQQPAWPGIIHRLGTVTMVASAMGIVLMVGMLVGMSLFVEEQAPVAEQSSSITADGKRPARSAPVLHRAAMTPLPLHQRPMRRPRFVQQPTPALQLPARAGYWLSEPPTPPPAPVQKMDGAP